MSAIDWAERGWMPDMAVRWGIRRLLADRLRMERGRSEEETQRRKASFIGSCKQGPIAHAVKLANEQHYEVPSDFYLRVLGPRLKYSSCLWSDNLAKLKTAEEAMLRLTCDRAELRDGMDLLELGCGWGSLSLWMAEHYPTSRIVAVSNSRTQKAHIDEQARLRGFADRLHVVTSDMNDFDTERRFDRVVSVEMFEHMRNHDLLLRRIANWLRDEGKLFVHIFVHRELAYAFDADGDNDWMARHFFTGGIMPSFDWFRHFEDAMRLERQWPVNGQHYAKTLEAWLRQLDEQRDALESIFRTTYGSDASVRLNRWRIFLMACAELFAYAEGNEWHVGHYLLSKAS
ncbi:MAG: cyclopropane-fatty-acyl-phospholipid synthase family protein [Gemmataceae bacterium]